MPRQQQDEGVHGDILKNFSIDEEDNEQLGENEDRIEFADDEEDDSQQQEHVEDDHEEEEEDTTEAVVDDEEEQRRQDRFAFKEDRMGNFIDKDGNIIVRRGKARDVFVKIKKAYQKEQNEKKAITTQFQEVVGTARELLNRYNTLKEEKNHFEKVGLSDTEARQAAEIGALMKLDPKAGVRKILTILHLNGTDLSDIGVTSPVDAKEVARHTLEMQELRKPKEKTPEEKAREEVVGFLDRHPTARQYTGPLAEAKRRFPQMTYDEIWYQLLVAANKQEKRQPQRPIPRNSHRTTAPVAERNPGGKLSLRAVDPSQSFSQISRDLLRDIQALEKGQ